MIYQIKEKAVYVEVDAIFFKEIEYYGEMINSNFKDFSGINVGAVIYQSNNQQKVYDLRTQLEISRIRAINLEDGLFCFIEELANEFLVSKKVAQLQKLYDQEFNIILHFKNYELLIGNEQIFIPAEANDEQILAIQKILDLYFYEVVEISEEDNAINNEIDWDKSLTILFPFNNKSTDTEKSKVESIQENKVKMKDARTEEKEIVEIKLNKRQPNPWWKFW